MLDEGVRAAFGHLGIDLRTVAYGEWEAPAASQLVALMEAGLLDEAPVWCGDFRRLDAGRFHGAVDVVVAGFPCQDLSVAGRRAGLDGKRSGLFFSVVDVADASGAWLLVLENVGGIASATASVMDEEEGALEERAAARVLGELADRGWSAEWLTVSASDVGASHGRERWFCIAWRGVAHAERAQLGPLCSCGACRLEGDHAGGRQAHRGLGVSDEALGDAARDHWRCGIGPAQAGTGADGLGRRGSSGAGGALAVPSRDGWNEGRPESGREQGRSDAAECGCAMAYASQPGLPQPERRKLPGARGGGG